MNQPAPAPAAKKPNHPPVPNFDTMATMKALEKTGFDPLQAEGLVECMRESQSRLATKEDLKKDLKKLRIELRGDMKTLKADLRGEMKTLKADLHAEIADLRVDMKGLEANLRTDMQDLFTRMLYYNLIAMGVATTIIGIVVSVAITLS